MPRVLPKFRTADGWAVTRMHYGVVPDYDYAAAAQGLSDADVKRELEIDWNVSAGKAVYPEWRELHAAVDDLPYDPELPITCGWDLPAATGGTMAFVPTQLWPSTRQWLIYPEVCFGEEVVMSVYDFGQEVAEYLYREFAAPAGRTLQQLHLVHYADPAGAQKPLATGGKSEAREKRSAYDTLRLGEHIPVGEAPNGEMLYEERPGLGWVMIPGAMGTRPRQETIRARLNLRLPGGAPALVVHPAAKLLLQGFRGAYNYPQRADGRYELDAGKTLWSHPMNALEYAATGLFYKPQKSDRPRSNRPPSRMVGHREKYFDSGG